MLYVAATINTGQLVRVLDFFLTVYTQIACLGARPLQHSSTAFQLPFSTVAILAGTWTFSLNKLSNVNISFSLCLSISSYKQRRNFMSEVYSLIFSPVLFLFNLFFTRLRVVFIVNCQHIIFLHVRFNLFQIQQQKLPTLLLLWHFYHRVMETVDIKKYKTWNASQNRLQKQRVFHLPPRLQTWQRKTYGQNSNCTYCWAENFTFSCN